MDISVDLSFAEAEADAERSKGTASGAQFANTFIYFRNLLITCTAARDMEDMDNSSTSNSTVAVTMTATAMAKYIRDGARPAASVENGYDFLRSCWENIINMIYGIPPNHPWHAIFVRTVHLLYELGDEPIFSSPNLAHLRWDGLYGLKYNFWDFVDDMMPWYYLAGDGGLENPQAREEVARWKSWTSLYAQMPIGVITRHCHVMQAIQPIESPAATNPMEAECDLWTACEWLTHTAYTALECLRYQAVHKEMEPLLPMGELCYLAVGSDKSCQKRWDWWKRRLLELGADADTETKQNVAKALASMDAAEIRHGEVQEEFGAEEGDESLHSEREL